MNVNPAESLLGLAARAENVHHNIPLWQGWCEVLEVTHQDMPTLMSRMQRVTALPEECRAALYQIPNARPQRYIGVLGTIEAAINQMNMSDQFANVRQVLVDVANREALEQMRTIIAPLVSPPDLAELSELAGQVQSLIEEFRAARDLPADLRAYVLDQLDQIQQALIEVDLFGAATLREAVERAVGGTLIQAAEHPEVQKDGRFKKFVSMLNASLLVVNIAAGALNVGERLQLLPGPTPTIVVVEHDAHVDAQHESAETPNRPTL